MRAVLGHVPRSRALAIAALAVLAITTAPLTLIALIAGIAASTAVLVAVAIPDTTREYDAAPRTTA